MHGMLHRMVWMFYGPLFLFVSLSGVSWSQSGSTSWVSNNDMLLFYEAIVRLQENALMTEPARTMVQKAIAGYLEQLDPFSHYLTPREYSVYNQGQNSQYAGVGMDIFKDRSGRLVCVPYPGGVAHKSGVVYGDTLTFVDGKTVENLSVFTVAGMVRGETNSSVTLTVQPFSGTPIQHSLIRQKISFESVQLILTGEIPVIKIIRFTSHTATELKKVVEQMSGAASIIIDLRGNTGGDLFSAIDAVSLFLKSGLKIIDMKTREGIKSYEATDTTLGLTSRLLLWQDSLTASAAEVFIVALTENGRAVSLGQTTFGKGVSQKIIELTDGSAIIVTNSALLSPHGVYFHKQGLRPDHWVDAAVTGTSDKGYWIKTMEILNLTQK
ncbi:S41 family peptidase [Desulfocicer niacini]